MTIILQLIRYLKELSAEAIVDVFITNAIQACGVYHHIFIAASSSLQREAAGCVFQGLAMTCYRTKDWSDNALVHGP